MGADPVTGQPPVASPADGAEPEVLSGEPSAKGPPRAVAQTDAPGAEVVWRERPPTGARPVTGLPSAASQADGAEPEALSRERSVAGPPPAAAQTDGAEVV